MKPNKRYTIESIIPPRPGSKVATLVLTASEKPPVRSVTVQIHWLKATRARIGARISFVDGSWLRYHWEELPADVQKIGFMDELYPEEKYDGRSVHSATSD